jgi:hypothetical protein
MSIENYVTIVEDYASLVADSTAVALLQRLADRLTAASKGGTASVKMDNTGALEATVVNGDGIACTVSHSAQATFVTINSAKV